MRMTPLTLAAALATGLTAQDTPKQTIVDLAVQNGSFQTLVAAAKAAGLVETLSSKGPFTIFAPTDEAFKKLGDDTISSLLEPKNKAKLASILTYHVVAGAVPASKVVGQSQLLTVQGQRLPIVVDEDGVRVAGARVTKTDLHGSNGIIHVIDSVMLPNADITVAENLVTAATEAGSFKTLLQAAVAAGLADTLSNGGPFTVFAPTDAAFAKLGDVTIADLLKPENKKKLASVLKYHVVAGDVPAATAVTLTKVETLLGQSLELKVKGKDLYVGGAKVVATDVLAKNGTIHVIDAVLLPR